MSEKRHLRLDDQLCFALYAATNAVTRAYRPLLRELNLTYPQYLVLLVLWQDGDRSVRDVAGRLGLASSAIIPLLDRLEAGGLVRRERDVDDRRRVHVRLTPQGRTLEGMAAQAQWRVQCQTELGEERLGALRDELKAMVVRMEAEASPSDDPDRPRDARDDQAKTQPGRRRP